MPSPCDEAKRRLVRLLRTLAKAYEVHVMVNRDSPPQDVARAYRSVARKTHPDKPGGSTKDFQALSAANDAWADIQRAERSVGRPPKAQRGKTKPLCGKPEPQGALVAASLRSPEQRDGFRIRARAVLFTYQGFSADMKEALQAWVNFVAFVKRIKKDWNVKHSTPCATTRLVTTPGCT